MKKYRNIHEAYQGILTEVKDNFEYECAPRDQKIREILDFKFKILNPRCESIITKDEKRNEVIKKYTEKECELYDSCSNKVEDFAKASKFWNKIANADGTVNSAYGYLIWSKKSCGNTGYEHHGKDEISEAELIESQRTPWEWAKQCLLKDKDSRQAILRFSLPEHQWLGNKDFTCTMHGIFQIRQDKLHLSVVMRSNDVVKGLAYDLPWFISLLDKMVGELKDTYPELTVGTYTHEAHSMHMYMRDLETINKMLGL